VPRICDLETPEERQKATEPARLESRFRYAEARIRKIVDGWPPLTEAQRDRLALLLRPGGDDAT
jgi:hypothetical protein